MQRPETGHSVDQAATPTGGLDRRPHDHPWSSTHRPTPRAANYSPACLGGRCELCEQRAQVQVHRCPSSLNSQPRGRLQPMWMQLMARTRCKTLIVFPTLRVPRCGGFPTQDEEFAVDAAVLSCGVLAGQAQQQPSDRPDGSWPPATPGRESLACRRPIRSRCQRSMVSERTSSRSLRRVSLGSRCRTAASHARSDGVNWTFSPYRCRCKTVVWWHTRGSRRLCPARSSAAAAAARACWSHRGRPVAIAQQVILAHRSTSITRCIRPSGAEAIPAFRSQ